MTCVDNPKILKRGVNQGPNSYYYSFDANNDGDITDNPGEFLCTTADTTDCPNDVQQTNIFLDLLNAGYTLSQIENAMLDAGTASADAVITEIFNCLENPISTTLMMLSMLSHTTAGQVSTPSVSPANTENTELDTTTTENTENTELDTTTTTTTSTSRESKVNSQHEFRLPSLPFTFNGLGIVNEDPR